MGIAQQLMEQMMCFAHDMTVNEVYLHVSVMNFPAQNLYKSFGFTVSKWIKNYYSDENEHALFMVNKDIPSYVKKNIHSKSPIIPPDSSMTQDDYLLIQTLLKQDQEDEVRIRDPKNKDEEKSNCFT